jgi:hypothetical protein|tara:strand:+ start:207 stop:452 length:246 start_codon:yes stop_codon:yes gene_type:complete
MEFNKGELQVLEKAVGYFSDLVLTEGRDFHSPDELVNLYKLKEIMERKGGPNMHGNNEVKHLYDAMESERKINAKNMERKI